MPAKKQQIQRLDIFKYFEGINSLVATNISKKVELSHGENARGDTIGTIEKRKGTRRLGASITATANYGLFYFDSSNANSSNVYRVSTVSGTTTIYYLNTSAIWTALSGGGTGLTAANNTIALAEGCCFITNNNDANRYIGADGTTVTTASSTSGHLYNSPVANKINYYKDRLYLSDYTVGSTRYKNSILFSSMPVGIVALVDGDHDANVTSLKVTDMKYIRASDSLDVYRGNSKIGTVTVNSKSTSTNTLEITSFGTDLKSSDELWVAGTYSGTRLFRWPDNPTTGVDVKEYNTFKISGGQNDSTKMFTNIGDVMMIANNYNIAVWNNYALKQMDLGIGCVSHDGWVKALGTLWFVHYTGIYATTGDRPRLMSAKIEKYITGATKSGLEAAAAGRKGMSVFFAIGDVTLYDEDGATNRTLSDVCLEYNMRTENWYVHTGIPATHFTTYIASTDVDRLEYAAADTGYPIYEFLKNHTDDAVTNDTEILFRIDSSNVLLNSDFEKISNPLTVVVEAERGNSIKCFVSLDNGRYYELQGSAVKGCTIFKITGKDETDSTPPRCRQLKISLRDYSKSICKISRIALTFINAEEEEESHPGKNE